MTSSASLAPTPSSCWRGPLPLYRDLNLGDNGDDVLAFQKALNSAGCSTVQSGTVTEDTLDAVTRLHRAHLTGVPSEGVTTIARKQLRDSARR